MRAVVDASLAPVLSDLGPLTYGDGGSPERDVPGYVRAASALRRQRSRLVIVQDDVNVLALHDERSRTHAVLLPAGEGGRRTFDDTRGNKQAKMDLEACASLPDGRLVAFGSGSTEARERLVVMRDDDVRVVDARALYAMLRSDRAFAGSELNIEGAVVIGDVLRLFQRGNGASTDGRLPVNATGDIPLDGLLRWLDGDVRLADTGALSLRDVVQYDLGAIGEVPFTFTDAALMADGRLAFLSCAEASPDAVRDGQVLGCRFGIIDRDAVRVADIHHGDGHLAVLKLEGLEPQPGSAHVFDVVADVDRPDQPALLGRLSIHHDA